MLLDNKKNRLEKWPPKLTTRQQLLLKRKTKMFNSLKRILGGEVCFTIVLSITTRKSVVTAVLSNLLPNNELRLRRGARPFLSAIQRRASPKIGRTGKPRSAIRRSWLLLLQTSHNYFDPVRQPWESSSDRLLVQVHRQYTRMTQSIIKATEVSNQGKIGNPARR